MKMLITAQRRRSGEKKNSQKKNQTDKDCVVCVVQAHIIRMKDAAAHPLRRTEGRRSSMGTAECFPISSCSSSLPLALQKESERFPGLEEEEEGSNY